MTAAPWLTVDDLPADRPELPGTAEQVADAWGAVIASATFALWSLSGRRWAGERTVTVEVWAPAGAHLDPCRPRPVRLPHRDARQLTAVTLADGTPLAVDDYLIDRGGYLGAAPGRAARLPTSSSSLVLTYTAGRTPPADAVAQATSLAVELGRAVVDPEGSALPDNVTSIQRQGVTMTMEAGYKIAAAGSTGLPAVDLWLATVNPSRLRRPPRSWSPDTDTRHRVIAQEATP